MTYSNFKVQRHFVVYFNDIKKKHTHTHTNELMSSKRRGLSSTVLLLR